MKGIDLTLSRTPCASAPWSQKLAWSSLDVYLFRSIWLSVDCGMARRGCPRSSLKNIVIFEFYHFYLFSPKLSEWRLLGRQPFLAWHNATSAISDGRYAANIENEKYNNRYGPCSSLDTAVYRKTTSVSPLKVY